MSQLIGIDWGSSNLRSFLLDDNGKILEKRSFPLGITRLAHKDFKPTFNKVIAAWPVQAPVLLCGMVGSAQGWLETAYVQCPASLTQVANALCDISSLSGRDSWIVSGICCRQNDDFTDLIRGEETQLLGAGGKGQICLPGTHSKWATIEEDKISSFSTFMTGEVFSLLSSTGLIAKTMDGDAFCGEAFVQGLDQCSRKGGLLHQLFSARARVIAGELNASQCHSYLSGILIGSELKASVMAKEVTLVGSHGLTTAYRKALVHLDPGIQINSISGEEACAKGLHRIWRTVTDENI